MENTEEKVVMLKNPRAATRDLIIVEDGTYLVHIDIKIKRSGIFRVKWSGLIFSGGSSKNDGGVLEFNAFILISEWVVGTFINAVA